MFTASMNLLSIPNNLDRLALSDSSLISSSTSSLFDNDLCLSNSGSSSQTDISPPLSPLKEDANHKFFRIQKTWGPTWNEILETPKLTCLAQGPIATVDEAGYEAGESDVEDLMPSEMRHKRKKLTKRLPSLNNLSLLEATDPILPWPLEKPIEFLKENQNPPPTKPVLNACTCGLDSPSPLVALPSPHIKGCCPRSNRLLSFSISNSPDSLSPDFPSPKLSEQFPILEMAMYSRSQTVLGLGLSRSSSASVSVASSLSLEATEPPTDSTSSNSDPQVSKPILTAKRYSLSGLGHGLPSTRRALSSSLSSQRAVPPSEATIRLVTPSKPDDAGDVSAQVQVSSANLIIPPEMNLAPSRNRQASVCLSVSENRPLFRNKRDLYTIQETLSTPTTSDMTSYDALASSSFDTPGESNLCYSQSENPGPGQSSKNHCFYSSSSLSNRHQTSYPSSPYHYSPRSSPTLLLRFQEKQKQSCDYDGKSPVTIACEPGTTFGLGFDFDDNGTRLLPNSVRLETDLTQGQESMFMDKAACAMTKTTTLF